MLQVKNISAGYGKKQVLFDVSFSIKQSEIIVLVGSNGSGKSTLLKAIYGLLPEWNQNQASFCKNSQIGIYFNDENITGQPASALLNKGLLYIPQKNNLFFDLTVRDNLEMAGLTIYDRKILKGRIDEALCLFPSLAPHLKRMPMNLSGGERQLLALAMATLHKPKMILIDEPFNGLSPKSIESVAATLRSLNEQHGVAILMIEHRIKEALNIAEKIFCLKLGEIYCIMRPNTDFDFHTLQEVFV